MFDAPVLFGAIALVVALAFVALPVVVIGQALRTRRRARTWTPTTALVRRVRTETRGGADDTRTVLVGTYEYRDSMGTTRTGEGDLGRLGVAVDGSEQHVPVLVDPLDGSRSMIDPRASGATAGFGCAAAILVVFLVIALVVLAVTAAALLSGP